MNLDHETGTLRGFEKKFEDGEIFRSASEICEIFLVPERITGKIQYRECRQLSERFCQAARALSSDLLQLASCDNST